ncbi:MAG TPA: hypothetical protein VGO47_06240 [Chlamydiales bacterium]|nr:hypothetical protein [Chlamydiales bacterium]
MLKSISCTIKCADQALEAEQDPKARSIVVRGAGVEVDKSLAEGNQIIPVHLCDIQLHD